MMKALYKKFPYRIYKVGRSALYTPCPPYRYATYSPWFSEEFKQLYEKIKDYTLVKEDRCYILERFVRHCLHLDGDVAECGVFKGGTAFLLAHTMQGHPTLQDKRLHLFDTFSGMPTAAEGDPSGHKRGDFGDTLLDWVRNYLRPFPFVEYHPGIMPDTFKGVQERKFSFVHVDVDLYQTAKECCEFFYGRMVQGGVMIFDDYGFRGYQFAEKKAVDDFFKDKPEVPISLRTGQCLVIKL